MTQIGSLQTGTTVQEFYSTGLAISTKATYRAGQKKFVDLCVKYDIQNVFPVD